MSTNVIEISALSFFYVMGAISMTAMIVYRHIDSRRTKVIYDTELKHQAKLHAHQDEITARQKEILEDQWRRIKGMDKEPWE